MNLSFTSLALSRDMFVYTYSQCLPDARQERCNQFTAEDVRLIITWPLSALRCPD